MIVGADAWQRLGETGRAAPAGSTDTVLWTRLAAYKRHVAGQYVSVDPKEIERRLPSTRCIVSEKVDGETWFLHADGSRCTLVSPTGRAICRVPVTDEAERLLSGWSGVLAGELHARRETGRPRVMDLHAALGGGEQARAERLCFAAFDLLQDGETDAQRRPFSWRADRICTLLDGGLLARSVRFEEADGPAEVSRAFQRHVVEGGAEGIVVRSPDGRIFKVKPHLSIDAAVVAFGESGPGISELHLALLRDDGRYQAIGRVRTGWSAAEGRELRERLSGITCNSAFRQATDQGTLVRWVEPHLVLDVKCNDLLTRDSRDAPIRRMRLSYSTEHGWQALRRAASVSLMHAVLVRVRPDKRPVFPDIRWQQVTALVPVEEPPAKEPTDARPSRLLLREVYTKQTKQGLCVRKVLAWQTNKSDPAYPAYTAFFTDFSPGRGQPLETDVGVAATREHIETMVDTWLSRRIKRGWTLAARQRFSDLDGPEDRTTEVEKIPVPPIAIAVPQEPSFETTIEIAFGPSTSPHFTTAARQARRLAACGTIQTVPDEKGRERLCLVLRSGLVEQARRLENLVRLVSAWKGTELGLNDRAVGVRELLRFVEELGKIDACFRRNRLGDGACRDAGALGCNRLCIRTAHWFMQSAEHGAAWYGAGSYDGKVVRVDKAALKAEVRSHENRHYALCPAFPSKEIDARIDALPDIIDPEKLPGWSTVYERETGKPLWVVPDDVEHLPYSVVRHKEECQDTREPALADSPELAGLCAAPPGRQVPPTRYADVCGQERAVRAIRDLVELPMRHGALFEEVGVRRSGGVLLYGPPGNGKTLLARAAAGESGAHVEMVAGPELLSKWVGESEEGLRAVFERARRLAPSLVVLDELDAIAPDRDLADQHHQRVLVSQLLVLLDGPETLRDVLVIGTTNRPDDIDPALRRPGRLDRSIYVGLPDESGRSAIFARHLSGMKTGEIDVSVLARRTAGFSGADIAFACREAGLLCIKEALARGKAVREVLVEQIHLAHAIQGISTERNILPARTGS